jgi:hypothetical protein
MTDHQKWIARTLATWGWYSHRYIAARCYRKSIEGVEDSEIYTVNRFLYKEKISVRASRDGLTREASRRAREILTVAKESKETADVIL